ncbi:hypothetical protein SPBR_08947 [Sporothrix brasiliensis 5110]|uniref:Endo-1,3(4)-beta-glucanase 1 carbohydrate binding domain-containing protein n=1 Tax=Sporothrix brasiliensis 5110 TaxID=1398154 RepID=A0A0C2ENL6_9PEZI|nr:uncharacterized protein SPBR_08947 [Sporothrix brasiliensis 5110]KIH87704.1 hypothetical protein SPBR_08947 [Sporothrix brasiliensis 5110]
MTKTLGLALAGLLAAAGSARADLQTCGDAQYDPSQYVCDDGNFLCPIVAGEGLSYCSGACYSKFMYTCTNNALAQLTPLAAGTPFTLTVSNPTAAAVDGLAVDACNLRWNLGIETCSYCPTTGVECPVGNTTVVSAPDTAAGSSTPAMDVVVPGGQAVYLDPSGAVGYTQAHSAQMPGGSITGGLVPYSGGGFVNLNSGGYGWAACPPTAAGGGGTGYTLFAVNADNKATLAGCTPVNLKVNPQPSGTIGAWQYT